MKSFSKMVYPYAVWMIIMIIVPMLMIVLYAFTTQGNDVLTFQFTLSNFARFFSDNVFPSVLWRSLKMAVITTLICILIGYPAAYAMAKSKPHSQAVMVLLITLPMWINMLVRTYAWKGILSDSPLSAEAQVYIGMVYNFLPFMILQIYTALSKIDPALITAAHDLGANDRDLPAESFRSHLRHHAGLPACGFVLLHSETARRRKIRAHRKPDRRLLHLNRRLELRFCNLHDHGSHHPDLHVCHAQIR